MLEIFFSAVVILFFWLAAPAIIAKSKGRRWWVWMLIAVPFPILTLMITMFMHPAPNNGNSVG